jgi:acetoin utilization protein AcuB
VTKLEKPMLLVRMHPQTHATRERQGRVPRWSMCGTLREATMRVQDVMTDGVQTAAPGDPADEAWLLMRERRIHHLVVTDGTRVVGVLSDRDAGGLRGPWVRRNRTVGELMSSPVITVPPSTPVRKAANLMRGRSIGCLVVTKANRLLGIVTVSDLLELLGRGAERGTAAATTRWSLKQRGPHRKRHQATRVWLALSHIHAIARQHARLTMEPAG